MSDGSSHNRLEDAIPFVMGIAILVGLYAISLHSFLLFHTLAEMVNVGVAWGLFFIVWNLRREIQNSALVIIGLAFFFSGIISILHLLAYKGLGVFPAQGANLPTQLWISARYVLVVSLAAAPWVPDLRSRWPEIFFGYVLATAGLIVSIFSGYFPDCYLDGTGLTLFKEGSEYALAALLVVSAAGFYLRRYDFDPGLLKWLLLSLAATFVSELAFTEYSGVYDISNVVGHLFMILATWFMYRALIEYGLNRPLEVLFFEHKRYSEKLSENEARYRALTECSLTGIFIHQDGIVQYVNERMAEMVGRTPDELLGKPFLDLVYHADKNFASHRAQDTLSGESPPSVYQLRCPTNEGDILWVEVLGSRIDYRGRPAVMGNIADITERKRVEDELAAERERLSVTLQSIGDAVISTDTEGAVVLLNKVAEELTGWTQQEAQGLKIEEVLRIINESTRLPAENPLNEVFQTGRKVGMADDTALISRDGVERIIADSAAPIVTAGGKLLGAAIVFRDVTELKASEKEITSLNRDLADKVDELTKALRTVHAQNNLLQAVHRAHRQFISSDNPELIFGNILHDLLVLSDSECGFMAESMTDDEGRAFLHNHAVSDIAWDDASRAAYRKFAEEKGLDLYEPRGLVWETILTGSPIISNDPSNDPRRCGLPEGHPDIEAFLGVPFYYDGDTVGMAGLANRKGGYDQALIEFLQPFLSSCAQIIKAYRFEKERVEAERRLAQAHGALEGTVKERTAELDRLVEELKLKNQELERFAYTASHDLRSPLITIQAFVGLIVSQLASGDTAQSIEDLGRVRAAAQHMDSLLQGLLELSRVGRILSQLEPTPLEKVVDEALDRMQGPILRSGARIEIVGEFPTLSMDKMRMVQVVQNLVENAIKFSPGSAPPYVEIGCYCHDEEAILYVKDHGVGIGPEYRERIFGLFSQLDPSAPGTGLGLTLVQKIVEHHNGRVWVESNKDEPGSTLLVALPKRSKTSP